MWRRPSTTSRRRASHAACGMVASGAASLGFAGVQERISSKVYTMCTPLRLLAPPAHFTQRRSSCKAGADHQARWAGAGGGGSELEALVTEAVPRTYGPWPGGLRAVTPVRKPLTPAIPVL